MCDSVLCPVSCWKRNDNKIQCTTKSRTICQICLNLQKIYYLRLIMFELKFDISGVYVLYFFLLVFVLVGVGAHFIS